MFDLGFQELVLIFVVALIVVGPKRLPEIARALGKGIAEVKRAMSGVKDQIDAEFHEVKDLKELKNLDPISLKNELFKSEDLFKVNDIPQKEPLRKTETSNLEKPADSTTKADAKPDHLSEHQEKKG